LDDEAPDERSLTTRDFGRFVVLWTFYLQISESCAILPENDKAGERALVNEADMKTGSLLAEVAASTRAGQCEGSGPAK
jgi:hypothetical protein